MKTIIDAINEAAVSKMAEDLVFPTVRDTAIQATDVETWLRECEDEEQDWLVENHWDDSCHEPVDGACKYIMSNANGKIRAANNRDSRDKLRSRGWSIQTWEWKTRTLLPAKYTSAKNTVKKALEAGVPIDSSMGKTAMGKATKEVATPTVQDYNKKAINLAKQLSEIAEHVDDAVWTDLMNDLKNANVPF